MANNKKVRICAIGGASEDVFLRSDEFDPKREGKQLYTHLPLGAKLTIDGVIFSTGGGATNAAVTFARNDLFSEYIGKVGKDPAGQVVLRNLDEENVSTENVVYSDKGTQYSAILLSDTGERTILIYRGAAHSHVASDYEKIDFTKYDWVYLSSLAGKMPALETIIKRAHSAGCKIAINPGEAELVERERLIKLLSYVYVLSVNKEEARMIRNVEKPRDLTKSLLKVIRNDGVVIVSDGANGSYISDNQQFIRAGMYEDVPVLDRTGAGDAFSSGFVASLASGRTLEESVVFASANSTNVVRYIGAKEGILSGFGGLHDMPLDISQV